MRTRISLALLALALAFAAVPAAAQHHEEDLVSPNGPGRWSLGIDFTVGQPRGEFADFVDESFGASLSTIYRLDEAGILGIRLDGGFLVYGSETMRVPLSSTIGGRVLVDVNTTNNIAFAGIGPQIGVPTGRLRPYVNGFAGVSYLFTTSSVEGSYDDEPFATTKNFDDATFSWGGGAGLYVPLRGGNSPISLDLGVRYHNNGQARYLREGDIEDLPDNTIRIYPVRSDTDLLTYHLGITVGVGGR